MNIYVKSFADLMNGEKHATITCLIKNQVVRELTVDGENVTINPGTGYPLLTIPLSTPILYEPWSMDRGSLVFEHPDFLPHAKICTEGDLLTFDDGTTLAIWPNIRAKRVSE